MSLQRENFNRSYLGKTKVYGVRTRGNPDSFFGPAIIAFVDLLGFSSDLRANWTNPTNNPLEKLLRIKSHATTSIKTAVAYADTSITPAKVIEAYRSRLHTVSDSIVIASALPPTFPIDTFARSLFTLYITIGFVWRSAIEEGYTIRGGIEFGQLYWAINETVGPAFIDAYELESKWALASRVILGPKLLDLVLQTTAQDADRFEGMLSVSFDRLIELRPLLAKDDHLRPLETLQRAAFGPKDKEKYQYLLEFLRADRQSGEVQPSDLKFALNTLAGGT
jgi:hypothetical protein